MIRNVQIGIDATNVRRFKAIAKSRTHVFLQKVFTKRELEYCFSFADVAPHLAGHFAAKEAIVKAFLGKYTAPSIEIRHSKNGAPEAWHLGRRIAASISITHEGPLAIAIAVR